MLFAEHNHNVATGAHIMVQMTTLHSEGWTVTLCELLFKKA
jgi:hypothetical protein